MCVLQDFWRQVYSCIWTLHHRLDERACPASNMMTARDVRHYKVSVKSQSIFLCVIYARLLTLTSLYHRKARAWDISTEIPSLTIFLCLLCANVCGFICFMTVPWLFFSQLCTFWGCASVRCVFNDIRVITPTFHFRRQHATSCLASVTTSSLSVWVRTCLTSHATDNITPTIQLLLTCHLLFLSDAECLYSDLSPANPNLRRRRRRR